MPTETVVLSDSTQSESQDNKAPMESELAITRPSETTAGIFEIETMLDKIAKDLVRFVEELKPPSKSAIKSVRLTEEGVRESRYTSLVDSGPCIL